MEIVSEPDLRSPDEARDYLVALRDILVHLGVCDGNMEQGSFRCDANVSLRPRGQAALGTKVELKNMNSFRYVQQALEYEAARQEALLDEGGAIVQETRLFDPKAGTTHSMRRKEEAHDYRYFPEPDLVPLAIDAAWVARVARRAARAARGAAPPLRRGARPARVRRRRADRRPGARRLVRGRGGRVPAAEDGQQLGHGRAAAPAARLPARDVRDCPVPPAELAALLAAVEAGRSPARWPRAPSRRCSARGRRRPR